MAVTYPPVVPDGWHAPRWWLGHPATRNAPATGAYCIHGREGAWNSIGHARDSRGRPITYFGGYQFLASTWASVGGPDRADRVSPREQTYRAWLVYLRDGRSWREWGTARICGLK